MRRRSLFLSLPLLPQAAALAQGSWTVGPGGTAASLAEAVAKARDGDTINILPGQLKGDVAVITQKRLTLRGLGRTPPQLLADGRSAEGKAILVVRDGDIVIENLEFRGARVSDANGAGIRFERGRLTVRRCQFMDNENGILTANFRDAELTVEDSVFGEGVRLADNLNHLLYAGNLASLRVTGSRFHNSATGHLIKSRAARTWLAYNLFVDGPQGIASYEVDLPNGGDATLIGNVIAQGPNSANRSVVAYGAEGSRWPSNRLRLAHNTLINEQNSPAWFLRVFSDKLPKDTAVLAINNLLLGPGVFTLGAQGEFHGNWPGLRRQLRDPDTLDFRLPEGSLLRRSVDPAARYAPELQPTAEFQLPVGTHPLPARDEWLPGAFQR